MIRHTVTFLLSGVLLAVALTLPSTSVQAVEYGGIGARPANPDPNNERASSIFVFKLQPNEAKEDGIVVYNNTAEEKTISLYAVDAQTSSTGAFTCKQKVEAKEDVASWMKLSKDTVTLASNTSETVPFSLLIPEKSEVGEHNGCIVIEDNKQQNNAQNGVSLNFRSALRVAVTVPGEIKKDLAFTDYKILPGSNKSFTLTPYLENKGNVSVDAKITVKARNILAFKGFSADGTFPVLAYNKSEFNFEMKQPFWGGLYATQATATYNSDPRAGIGEKGTETTITSATKFRFIAPKPVAAAIELTVAAVIIAFVSYRIRSRKQLASIKTSWSQYTVKTDDDIKSVAVAHNISWKKLAKVNGIKEPYTIKHGQEILVPGTSAEKPKKTVRKKAAAKQKPKKQNKKK